MCRRSDGPWCGDYKRRFRLPVTSYQFPVSQFPSFPVRLDVLETGNWKLVTHFGKITGSTLSVVYTQRSLCPHSGTMIALCFAPSASSTNLTKASPLARRVGPCAMAPHDESKPPSGSVSTWPRRKVAGRETSCFFNCASEVFAV